MTTHKNAEQVCADMDDQPFCEQHPDIRPTVVRGVEGDDVAYECPECKCPICGVDTCRCQFDIVK